MPYQLPIKETNNVDAYKRLQAIFSEGETPEYNEKIHNNLNELLGETEKYNPKFVWSFANVKKWFSDKLSWIETKLFPNPNMNKFYKRKK